MQHITRQHSSRPKGHFHASQAADRQVDKLQRPGSLQHSKQAKSLQKVQASRLPEDLLLCIANQIDSFSASPPKVIDCRATHLLGRIWQC